MNSQPRAGIDAAFPIWSVVGFALIQVGAFGLLIVRGWWIAVGLLVTTQVVIGVVTWRQWNREHRDA